MSSVKNGKIYTSVNALGALQCKESMQGVPKLGGYTERF